MRTAEVPDLVTVGETMAAFISDDAPDRFQLSAAGAESNVAAGAAQLGAQVEWHSRLGDDQLGRFVNEWVRSHGVAPVVQWDQAAPTGVCVKEIGDSGSRMRYYRSQSAARQLDLLDLAVISRSRWIHLTGVTPALSQANHGVVVQLLSTRSASTRVSFDVNYRPALWSDADRAAQVLVPMARQADVVFIGDDEAQALLGSAEPEDVAGALLVRTTQELVLKRGPQAASVLSSDAEVSEPAQVVRVVDVTGAGDAFAAGYITASQWQWPASGRLRLGHFLAARAVGVRGDVGPPVTPQELAQLADSVRQPLPKKTGDAQP